MATNRIGHSGDNVYPHDETAHDSLTHPKKIAHLPPPRNEREREERAREEGEPEDDSPGARARARLFAVKSEIAREVSRAGDKSLQLLDRAAYTAGHVLTRARAKTAGWRDRHPLRMIAVAAGVAFGVGFIWRIARSHHE